MPLGKRHPFGYGQPSNHTPSPTMPRGRSQARADAFRHNTTVRGLMQEYTLRSDATNPRRSAYIPPNTINSSSPSDVSKNRHPLGYPQPPSLTLPPGRFQTRAGNFPFVQGVSDMASTDWLATNPWQFFDGSLGGMPATITSEVAETVIGSAVEEHREQPEVLPPQGATATSTDLGAQGDQEEFRAASPMDDEKSTSNSEPKVDPEPHPTAASDGKGVGAAEAEPDGIDPASPSSSIGAVDDNKFLDNDPTQSDESRTPSGKEQADASLHNATDHPSPKTLVRMILAVITLPSWPCMELQQERCYSEAAPEPQVVVTPPLDHSQHGSVDIPPNANDSISPPDPSPSSTLPPGGSQPRAGDLPSVLETSGMALTERLATSPRRSPYESWRGTLATVTSEVADTGIGSGVEEHREQPLVPPPQGVPYLHPIAAMDESYELRTQSSREREDADPHTIAFHSTRGSPTPVIVCHPIPPPGGLPDRWLLHPPNIHSVGVLTYYRMRSTPLALRMTLEMDTQVKVNTPDAVLCLDSNCCDPVNFDAAATSRGRLQSFTIVYRDRTKHLRGLH